MLEFTKIVDAKEEKKDSDANIININLILSKIN